MQCLFMNIYYTSYQKCEVISSPAIKSSLNVPMQTQAVVKIETLNVDEPLKKNLTLTEKRALFMEFLGDSISRDFIRYKCKNFKRIGGYPNYVSRVPHDLYRYELIFFLLKFIYLNKTLFNSFRVDGAWFLCFDEGIKPKAYNCNIISLGINDDPSFDEEMYNTFKCVRKLITF